MQMAAPKDLYALLFVPVIARVDMQDENISLALFFSKCLVQSKSVFLSKAKHVPGLHANNRDIY